MSGEGEWPPRKRSLLIKGPPCYKPSTAYVDCEKDPRHPTVRHARICRSPYHGSRFRTKNNHASNLFQITRRTTEAGEQSLQHCRCRHGGGRDKTFEHPTWFLYYYSQLRSSGRLRTVHRIPSHLVYRKQITRHPFLPPVRHFLSRTQSVQQGRGHRNP